MDRSSCDVRRIDFKNFTFKLPDRDPSAAPAFQYVTYNHGHRWTLHSGGASRALEDNEAIAGYASVNLRNVIYGDLTGDGRAEAVITLDADTGGTQHRGFVMIYSCRGTSIDLMATFLTGDRAAEGIVRASIISGRLVIEVNDPLKATADCCSTGTISRTFSWAGTSFNLKSLKRVDRTP